MKETGTWADVLMLAVPFRAIDDTIRELGSSVQGKTLVDVTRRTPITVPRTIPLVPASAKIPRSQCVIRFQLALFRSTILRSPASPSELRMAGHPSLAVQASDGQPFSVAHPSRPRFLAKKVHRIAPSRPNGP